jgi:AcrR family transcriptional regulator
VLDAAARLFARHGVDGVSLRDIAAEANVSLGLISRYVGDRRALIDAVLTDLSDQMAQSLTENQLLGQGFEPDTLMGKWARIIGALTIAGHPISDAGDVNPVLALAGTLEHSYAVDEHTARLRAAQIAAAGLGWRIFEAWLVAAARLDDVPLETLRDELVRSARRLGATPWPSPPDPPTVLEDRA